MASSGPSARGRCRLRTGLFSGVRRIVRSRGAGASHCRTSSSSGRSSARSGPRTITFSRSSASALSPRNVKAPFSQPIRVRTAPASIEG